MQFVKKEESSVSGGFVANTSFKPNYMSKNQEIHDSHSLKPPKDVKSKSIFNNREMYYSLFSKPNQEKSVHKTTMDETTEAYENIYNEKELCDLKVNNTTIKSLTAKRSLRNYKSQPNRSSI
jgi:hypothetical protein